MPATTSKKARQQLIFRGLLWFSAYGLIVTLVFNAAFWLLERSLSALLAYNAGGASDLIEAGVWQLQVGFWGFSGYMLLLLISSFFSHRQRLWAIRLTLGLLAGILGGIGFALALLVTYYEVVSQLSGSLTWGLGLLLTALAGLTAWALYECWG